MVQPPTGDQPQQPPYGGQPPPYDPAQPPYAQPYGNEPSYSQPPYGSGGYYPPPPKQSNGFAIAGIILAILVAPLGLIFSIIGLTKSKALAGAGKALSIAGIIVSVLAMGGGAALVAVVANSTAADPGCISAESAAHRITNTFNADATAMTRDQSNPPALRTDLNHFLNDVRTLQGEMTTAAAQATHQSVQSQIAAVNSDLSTFSSSLQAIEQGNVSQVSQMESAATKVQNDGNALDSICTKL